MHRASSAPTFRLVCGLTLTACKYNRRPAVMRATVLVLWRYISSPLEASGLLNYGPPTPHAWSTACSSHFQRTTLTLPFSPTNPIFTISSTIRLQPQQYPPTVVMMS